MFGFLKRENINRGIDEFRATAGAVLLDVRTREEYRSGHVPGSRNIAVDEIEAAASLVADRDTPLFVHCLSGARSGRAVGILKQMGYTNVKNIGGFNAYSGPVERGA